MLQELAPDVADRATVDVLDVGFEQAVTRVRQLLATQAVDVVVAAGSNGAYLRQHLELPVVLVKVGGFDLMQALAQARRLSGRIGLLTYEGMAPDLARFDRLFDFDVIQRAYRTEDEARLRVKELQQAGVEVVVGSGVAVDVAEQLGLTGLFLYSMDAVREALDDAVEVARAARIEQAKRDFINAQLRRESGAAISPTEFDSANKQYFPTPGDSAEVIQQKAANRRAAVEAMGREGGPSYKPKFSFDEGGRVVPYGRPKASQSSGPISKAQYDALPSGSTFTAPDGSVRVKP